MRRGRIRAKGRSVVCSVFSLPKFQYSTNHSLILVNNRLCWIVKSFLPLILIWYLLCFSPQTFKTLWFGVHGPDDLVESCRNRPGCRNCRRLVHGALAAQQDTQLFAEISCAADMGGVLYIFDGFGILGRQDSEELFLLVLSRAALLLPLFNS